MPSRDIYPEDLKWALPGACRSDPKLDHEELYKVSDNVERQNGCLICGLPWAIAAEAVWKKRHQLRPQPNSQHTSESPAQSSIQSAPNPQTATIIHTRSLNPAITQPSSQPLFNSVGGNRVGGESAVISSTRQSNFHRHRQEQPLEIPAQYERNNLLVDSDYANDEARDGWNIAKRKFAKKQQANRLSFQKHRGMRHLRLSIISAHFNRIGEGNEQMLVPTTLHNQTKIEVMIPRGGEPLSLQDWLANDLVKLLPKETRNCCLNAAKFKFAHQISIARAQVKVVDIAAYNELTVQDLYDDSKIPWELIKSATTQEKYKAFLIIYRYEDPVKTPGRTQTTPSSSVSSSRGTPYQRMASEIDKQGNMSSQSGLMSSQLTQTMSKQGTSTPGNHRHDSNTLSPFSPTPMRSANSQAPVQDQDMLLHSQPRNMPRGNIFNSEPEVIDLSSDSDISNQLPSIPTMIRRMKRKEEGGDVPTEEEGSLSGNSRISTTRATTPKIKEELVSNPSSPISLLKENITPEPSSEPIPEPTAEPSPESTPEPTPEPSPEPNLEFTLEPTRKSAKISTKQPQTRDISPPPKISDGHQKRLTRSSSAKQVAPTPPGTEFNIANATSHADAHNAHHRKRKANTSLPRLSKRGSAAGSKSQSTYLPNQSPQRRNPSRRGRQ
ncbi:hypothetical protein F4805DRAFT_108822 [Annulohypoxylon moriforme]|nr:hypothetical protein F4805DRAFT_108822 [Annulohypoxylon moriforme]